MRLLDRLLAAVLALAIAVLGLLAVAEIVLAHLGRQPWLLPYDTWYRAGVRNPWSSGGMRWLSGALALGGLILLVLQLVPRRPSVLVMAGGRGRAVLARRNAERTLESDVRRVEGVAAARARIGRRSTDVVARTDGRAPDDVQQRVLATVEGRLRRLALAGSPPVRVRLDRRRGR